MIKVMIRSRPKGDANVRREVLLDWMWNVRSTATLVSTIVATKGLANENEENAVRKEEQFVMERKVCSPQREEW